MVACEFEAEEAYFSRYDEVDEEQEENEEGEAEEKEEENEEGEAEEKVLEVGMSNGENKLEKWMVYRFIFSSVSKILLFVFLGNCKKIKKLPD